MELMHEGEGLGPLTPRARSLLEANAREALSMYRHSASKPGPTFQASADHALVAAVDLLEALNQCADLDAIGLTDLVGVQWERMGPVAEVSVPLTEPGGPEQTGSLIETGRPELQVTLDPGLPTPHEVVADVLFDPERCSQTGHLLSPTVQLEAMSANPDALFESPCVTCGTLLRAHLELRNGYSVTVYEEVEGTRPR